MWGLSEYMQKQLDLAGSLFADILLIGAVFLLWKCFQKKPISDLGFLKKNLVKEYLCGALCGTLLFFLAFVVCVLADVVKLEGMSSDTHKELLFLFLMGYMIQGMAEEILCRGYFMGVIREAFSLIPAIFMNSLVFAAIHLANPGVTGLALLNLFLFGIFASLFFLDRGSLWGIGGFHAFWNFTQGNILGLSVSGNENACSLFESRLLEQGKIINGGSFGLEGGLGVTVILTAGILFLLCRNMPKLCGSKRFFRKKKPD